MPEVAENGTYALLTACHIDDLTEAVRAQTTNQAIANELTRTQTGAVKALTAALDWLTLALAPRRRRTRPRTSRSTSRRPAIRVPLRSRGPEPDIPT